MLALVMETCKSQHVLTSLQLEGASSSRSSRYTRLCMNDFRLLTCLCTQIAPSSYRRSFSASLICWMNNTKINLLRALLLVAQVVAVCEIITVHDWLGWVLHLNCRRRDIIDALHHFGLIYRNTSNWVFVIAWAWLSSVDFLIVFFLLVTHRNLELMFAVSELIKIS